MSIIFHNYINNRHKYKYIPVSRYKIIFPYTKLYKRVIGFDMCHNSFLLFVSSMFFNIIRNAPQQERECNGCDNNNCCHVVH